MLKGFLILIFISSAVALIAIQISKPQTQAPQTPVTSNTDEGVDMDNIVFHTLVRPEDKSKSESTQPMNNTGTSCTTDLDCETTLKVLPFDFIDDGKIDSNTPGLDSNASDSIKTIINESEDHSQVKQDEILDLIDNLADLQERIEKNQ